MPDERSKAQILDLAKNAESVASELGGIDRRLDLLMARVEGLIGGTVQRIDIDTASAVAEAKAELRKSAGDLRAAAAKGRDYARFL